MGEFEKVAFESNNQLLDLMIFWKRFIDDVLGLFKGNEAEFEDLVEWLNSIMKGVVKFKSNYSTEKVEFLDLIISIEGGKLKTNLFIKPSNLQLFLDFKSNHPKHCKIGIVYGQALRIIERCSDLADANLHLDKLKGKLFERNYPVGVVEKQFDRAKKQNRKQLIYKSRNKKADNKVRCIFTFNEGNPPLHLWLRQAKKCLVKNEKAKELGEKMQITYRQPKNLKKITAGLPKVGEKRVEDNPGCHKCGKNCHACKILTEGKYFVSTNTGKRYNIKQRVSCDSTYIIYLGTCKKCKGQYIGKSTQPFKRRHSGHKQEIKNLIGGLGHHYGGPKGCGYENISMKIIEKVEEGDHLRLGVREVYWQHQMRCFVQNGGGGHCYRKEK